MLYGDDSLNEDGIFSRAKTMAPGANQPATLKSKGGFIKLIVGT